jgi:hypothetical protein
MAVPVTAIHAVKVRPRQWFGISPAWIAATSAAMTE